MYLRPIDLDAALAAITDPGVRLVAGGTDLFATGASAPPQGPFLDLSKLEPLRRIDVDAAEIRIGGAVTWSEIARADLPPAFAALKAAAREVGAVQIQNRGTIGGNLCNASPAADGVPPLLILDASVELASQRGVRRLPLEEFLLGPRRTARAADEILTAVIVPAPSRTARSCFLKLGARRSLVISIVMVAAMLDFDDEGSVRQAWIAVGACSPVARRLRALELRIVERARPPSPLGRGAGGAGSALDGETVGFSAEPSERVTLTPAPLPEGEGFFAELAPLDDVRADAAYRREAAMTLCGRALEACLRGEPGGVA